MNPQTESQNKNTKATFDRGVKSQEPQKFSAEDHEEGTVTKAIENQTSKVPSVAYLGLAIGSIAVALGLAVRSERKGWANFVGLWAPTFLLLGIYNKIVKTHGSDMESKMKPSQAW